MNWDEVAGSWRQLRGNVIEMWGRLTDNDLRILAGRRDQLLGQVQASCGIKPEEAEKDLKDWGVWK
ncbi:MAG: CsbD family protein [Syntrophobacteraceae bacterium]